MSGTDSGVLVRRARADDTAVLFELIGELARYEQLADAVTGDADLLGRALFGDEAAEAIVAEAGGETVGYAIFFSTFSTFECRAGIWVEDLFVRQDRRNRGIGRALIGHIAGLAVARKCARLEWSVLDWNESAIRFYDGLGASRMEQWRTLRLDGDALTELAAGMRSQGQAPCEQAGRDG